MTPKIRDATDRYQTFPCGTPAAPRPGDRPPW